MIAGRRLRFAVLALIALAVVASPTLVIILHASRGSASFGDTEMLGPDRVASATLDIEVGSRTVPIRAAHLAPGDLAAGTIEFTNGGSVPLRYAVAVDASSPGLVSWLTWWFVMVDGTTGCPTAAQWTADPPEGRVVVDGQQLASVGPLALFGDAATGPDVGDRVLDVGASDLLCVAVGLSFAAPNEVQALTSELRFVALAEQRMDPPAGAQR